jgi:HSP20 family protein
MCAIPYARNELAARSDRGSSFDCGLTRPHNAHKLSISLFPRHMEKFMADDVAIRQSGSSGGSSQVAQRRPAGSLFGDVFGFDPLRSFVSAAQQIGGPYGVEISRKDNGYTVEIPVPGFSPDQIDLTVQDDTVMISGSSERRNFTRQIVLPDEIDPESITAMVENGMLRLQLPLRPQAQPRKIAIQASSQPGQSGMKAQSSNGGQGQ